MYLLPFQQLDDPQQRANAPSLSWEGLASKSVLSPVFLHLVFILGHSDITSSILLQASPSIDSARCLQLYQQYKVTFESPTGLNSLLRFLMRLRAFFPSHILLASPLYHRHYCSPQFGLPSFSSLHASSVPASLMTCGDVCLSSPRTSAAITLLAESLQGMRLPPASFKLLIIGLFSVADLIQQACFLFTEHEYKPPLLSFDMSLPVRQFCFESHSQKKRCVRVISALKGRTGVERADLVTLGERQFNIVSLGIPNEGGSWKPQLNESHI